MATPVKLDKYQILIAPDSKKVQGLQTGDIVRRQYFDGTNVIYSLMCVLAYGTVKRTATEAVYDENGLPVLDSGNHIQTHEVEKDVSYFIGALLEGDAPQSNELLDFARITNLFNVDRSGALYLTASDDDAPFMDVIDGIGRNKSLCWPENVASEAFEDPHSQYIVKGDGLSQSYKAYELGNNRIVRLVRENVATGFSGLCQDFYELVAAERRVLVSYKARASRAVSVNAEVAYSNGSEKDAEWTEDFDTDWKYHFQAVAIRNSGRHIRSFKLDLSSLEVGEWVEIADFNIILQNSVSNFGDASSMRIGKLDGVADRVFGTLSGYGAYIQKLYASQTAHISGTLTAGDENGFASTFYAGKIHRNCFRNSCSVDFVTSVDIDNQTLINPTGMGNVYRTDGNVPFVMNAQDKDWLSSNLGKRFCFSFWGYAKNPCQLNIRQNSMSVGTVQIGSAQTHEWRRIHVFFDLVEPANANEGLVVSILPSWSQSLYGDVDDAFSIDSNEDSLFFTAPQLESGECCTQYQPTDDILDNTEDYGAWFARGGIGGTIQNPLLRLNYDGSGAIDTRTNSFKLNLDGSGHLANGNISWNQSGKVTFGSGVTLNWDNFGDDAQDMMVNRYIKIVGEDTFTILGQDGIVTGKSCTPASITLRLEEVGFTSSSDQRQWFYMNGGEFIAIPNGNGRELTITPDSEWFNANNVLTIKCEVAMNDHCVYRDVFTIRKIYDQGYTVVIVSSKGNSFQNGQCATVLTAYVYDHGLLVDPSEYDKFTFTWHRYKANDLSATDLGFTDLDVTDGANVITLNYEMDGSDIFVCELGVHDGFPYTLPIIF